MITYVIPTRDRPERLDATLRALGALDDAHAAEALVIDNASDSPVTPPLSLANGVPIQFVRLHANLGAAARNEAIARARTDWIVMLDDDSHPVDNAFARRLAAVPDDVAAVMADVHVPALGRREFGGLPEVLVGCGAAIRRTAFAAAGGYDPAFGVYAEEYDLCARLILRGWRIEFDPRWRVDHARDPGRRDADLMLERLVRNNGWVARRYAPAARLREARREALRRCRAVALAENARGGYARGLAALRASRAGHPRTPLSAAQYDRFIGLAAAREALHAAHRDRRFRSAALIEPGKNAWVVRRALDELGVRVVDHPRRADALVIATLSPGPMLDAMQRHAGSGRRVLAPWTHAADAHALTRAA